MVLALADSLDVPLRERNALLQSAGFAAVYSERPLDDERTDRGTRALRPRTESAEQVVIATEGVRDPCPGKDETVDGPQRAQTNEDPDEGTRCLGKN